MAPLAAGQVRFRIERFALTANTVTYATTGDTLGYWDFFPTGEPAWGCVPAMGWAEVVESRHPEVSTGGRYYCWYPMARYVDMTVTPNADGLRDEGPHRAAHAPVYRAYAATTRDALYQAGTDAEDRHALLGDRCECPTRGDRFNSTAAFDEHRVGRYGVNRRCLSADDMAAEGMRLRADGFWTTSLKSAGKFGVKDAVLSKAVTQNSRDREGGGKLPYLPCP